MYPAPFEYYPARDRRRGDRAARAPRRGREGARRRPQPDSCDEAAAGPARRRDRHRRGCRTSSIHPGHDGRIAIGAMTTHTTSRRRSCCKSQCPLLPEAATQIGDVQVRNRGTIGGSLVARRSRPRTGRRRSSRSTRKSRSPGPRGRRVVSAADFFVDLFQTAVAADEILVEIRVPVDGRVRRVRQDRTEGERLCASPASRSSLAAEGMRVGVTGVAAKPYRATAVEQALLGRRSPTPEAIMAAASRAADGVEPLSDIHASAEFRAHLARVNARRAIERALQRA